MSAITISPLCDKDGERMSFRQVLIDDSDSTHLFAAFVCTSRDCDRCYNEGVGYFYFVSDSPNLDHAQKLCEIDAMPMFLELIRLDESEIWRCPSCSGVTVRSGW